MSAGGCLYKNEVVLQHVKETEVRKKEREREREMCGVSVREQFYMPN